MRVNPIEETASSTHSDSGVFTASQARDDAPDGGFGAIVRFFGRLFSAGLWFLVVKIEGIFLISRLRLDSEAVSFCCVMLYT